jgi:hypothetical protein
MEEVVSVFPRVGWVAMLIMMYKINYKISLYLG